ncbi:MAG: hypothetical protein AABM42_12060 [Actinomycetota bacterium]
MGEPKLTTAELEAATRAGIRPARWRALKKVRNIRDWEALQRRNAKRDRGDAA